MKTSPNFAKTTEHSVFWSFRKFTRAPAENRYIARMSLKLKDMQLSANQQNSYKAFYVPLGESLLLLKLK